MCNQGGITPPIAASTNNETANASRKPSATATLWGNPSRMGVLSPKESELTSTESELRTCGVVPAVGVG